MLQKNVILTRSPEENKLLATHIRKLGFTPIFSPMLSHEILSCDFAQFSHYTDIIITSKFAAQIIAKEYTHHVRAWVVGTESATALQTNPHIQIHNIYPNVEQLAYSLPSLPHCIYFSGDHITQEIPSIDKYVIYNTHYIDQLSDEAIEAFKQNKVHVIMLYSANSAQNFVTLVKRHKLLPNLKNSVVIAISEEVGKRLKSYAGEVLFPKSPHAGEMILLLKSK